MDTKLLMDTNLLASVFGGDSPEIRSAAMQVPGSTIVSSVSGHDRVRGHARDRDGRVFARETLVDASSAAGESQAAARFCLSALDACLFPGYGHLVQKKYEVDTLC